MFLLLVISFQLEHEATVTAQQSYRVLPLTWANTGISFVLGVYLSLLFIESFSLRINKPILACVFVPCAVIGFYIPTAVSVSLDLPLWVTKLNTHGFPMLLSGFSLMLALFRQSNTGSVPTREAGIGEGV